MLETLEHHDYYNPEGFTDSDRAGFPPILPQRRQCFQRPARPFIFAEKGINHGRKDKCIRWNRTWRSSILCFSGFEAPRQNRLELVVGYVAAVDALCYPVRHFGCSWCSCLHHCSMQEIRGVHAENATSIQHDSILPILTLAVKKKLRR